MTDQELNRKIKGAFARATPDVLGAVRSQCAQQKGSIIPMAQPKKKLRWTAFASVAAALALVLGLGASVGAYQTSRAVSATVSLDVNPSIEIKITRNQKVLDVLPRNEEAATVIGTMDFKNSSLDVAVNALIGSMLRNGFLNELANSILVSVDDTDAARGKQLEEKLANEIDALLHTGTFNGSVLSQTIQSDSELDALAQQYGITAGKAKLIQQVVAKDSRYTFETLVPLSINELNLISESGSIQLDNVSSTGTASERAYIGADAAKKIAQTHLSELYPDAVITRWNCELDYEDGCMVYELEHHASGGGEFECTVNATTGAVLHCDHERSHHSTSGSNSSDHHSDTHHNDSHHSSSGTAASYIGADAAKAAALIHAGSAESDAYDWECELDRDDGRTVYEVEFKAGRYEYSYEIDAFTGDIVASKKEYDD